LILLLSDDDKDIDMQHFYSSHLARSSQEGAKKVKMKDMRLFVEEDRQIMRINIKNIIRQYHTSTFFAINIYNNMEPSNDNSNINDNAQVEDKLLKKKLLLSTIANECKSSSHTVLQQINNAINNGGKLDATVLSGGYTNYSYKVFIVDKPELCVFAKLCFEFALWNPDKDAHYDLQRTTNEYEIMVTMSKLAPDSIVNPILLSDIEYEGQSMKLLVTEWSKADEQFCNQFIDGSVDPRIAPKLANTLAALHLIKDFDPSFNETVKPCMEALLENTMKKSAMEASKLDNPSDRTEAYCTSLGEEVMLKIMNASIADYHKRDCLIHADSHGKSSYIVSVYHIKLITYNMLT